MQRVGLSTKRSPDAGFVLVDDEDYERVAALKWCRAPNGYAMHSTGMTMHRFILGLAKGDGLVVDHINRDKLDNRRANLSVGTQSMNMQNRIGNRKGGHSGYRGVTVDRRTNLSKRWIAQVHIGRRLMFHRRFASEEEAAVAAAEARRRLLPHSHIDR